MTNNLKIFVDCHVFDGSHQGTTTYIRGLYQELIKDKNKQFFFGANDISVIQEIFGTAGNVHYLKYSSQNKVYRLLFDIPRLIKKNKIDYAHFQYIVPPLKYCKYVNTIHDVLFLDYPEYFPLSYRIKNRFLFKWSAKHSDIVLTVSEYSKKQIQKHFGIKNSTITPNAVDRIFFEPYEKEKVQVEVKSKYNFQDYWIYISRWEPRKNHHTLLEVFTENEFYRNYSLVLVGDKSIPNPEFNQLYNSLEKSIQNKIIILYKIDFKELLLLLRGASLSVYPSIAEGFGIPPLEAAAAGISSICSNTTAMSDFNFFQNRLFNPLDKNDLFEKISFALNHQNNKEIIESVRLKYNWESSASLFLKAIEEKQ
ncbi:MULTISPECIES: glycosyltransferase family 4 protein [unclassified Flavobacterium]|jgi:glycosyltransferase involved in cell wall biosynthesis|uniref:glycosyltransferase family 4 protein n=3 Tax=Flavobacterium TaxID=237 RepID=UPI0025BB82D6|nr:MULTISPECIES: glycosyltransferase family 1 protein [unclassified Flavobacterium]